MKGDDMFFGVLYIGWTLFVNWIVWVFYKISLKLEIFPSLKVLKAENPFLALVMSLFLALMIVSLCIVGGLVIVRLLGDE